MSAHAHRSGDDLLQRRFDAVTAELAVARSALDRRNQLLREQSLALAERDARIRLLESSSRARSIGAASLALGTLRRARRVAGRVVRSAQRQSDPR